uniref:Uncharacterized protein n=1 Tax=Ditylenchus dipsaci TaxID=166011 RepID=A0A915DE06_9BILA
MVFLCQFDSAEAVNWQAPLVQNYSKVVFEVHNVESTLMSQQCSSGGILAYVKEQETNAIFKADMFFFALEGTCWKCINWLSSTSTHENVQSQLQSPPLQFVQVVEDAVQENSDEDDYYSSEEEPAVNVCTSSCRKGSVVAVVANLFSRSSMCFYVKNKNRQFTKRCSKRFWLSLAIQPTNFNVDFELAVTQCSVNTFQNEQFSHRRLQTYLDVDHPSLGRFLEELKKIQKLYDHAYEQCLRDTQRQRKRKIYQDADKRIEPGSAV